MPTFILVAALNSGLKLFALVVVVSIAATLIGLPLFASAASTNGPNLASVLVPYFALAVYGVVDGGPNFDTVFYITQFFFWLCIVLCVRYLRQKFAGESTQPR